MEYSKHKVQELSLPLRHWMSSPEAFLTPSNWFRSQPTAIWWNERTIVCCFCIHSLFVGFLNKNINMSSPNEPPAHEEEDEATAHQGSLNGDPSRANRGDNSPNTICCSPPSPLKLLTGITNWTTWTELIKLDNRSHGSPAFAAPTVTKPGNRNRRPSQPKPKTISTVA